MSLEWKSPNQVREEIVKRATACVRRATANGQGNAASVLLAAMAPHERQDRAWSRIIEALADAHRDGVFADSWAEFDGAESGEGHYYLTKLWESLPPQIHRIVARRSSTEKPPVAKRSRGAPVAQIRAVVVRVDRQGIDGAWWGLRPPSLEDLASIVVLTIGAGDIIPHNGSTEETWDKLLDTVGRARARSITTRQSRSSKRVKTPPKKRKAR